MPAVVKDTGTARIPAPAGVHNAVCVDVVELGLQQTKFGAKDMIALIWEIDEEHPSFERRFTVTKRYNRTLNEKGTLSKDLESWRGRPFTAEERAGFDVERLIGVPCMLNIVHNESAGAVYANVTSVTTVAKGMQKLAPSPDYVRVMDRENSWDVRSQPQAAAEPEGDGAGDYFDAKDELPF